MKIETISVDGWPAMIRGLRLPFKKECRSVINSDKLNISATNQDEFCKLISSHGYHILLHNKDLTLLQNLIKKGDEHAKVMRFVNVSFEINAPRFFWSEFDTYKISTIGVSESTMHTIINDELTPNNFLIEDYEDELEVYKFLELIKEYKRLWSGKKLFLKRKIKKRMPESFLQKRVIQTNYQVLRRIYLQRKNHQLTEWNDIFVNWVESLPLSNELITYK